MMSEIFPAQLNSADQKVNIIFKDVNGGEVMKNSSELTILNGCHEVVDVKILH